MRTFTREIWNYRCMTCDAPLAVERPGRGATPATFPCWLCDHGRFRRTSTQQRSRFRVRYHWIPVEGSSMLTLVDDDGQTFWSESDHPRVGQ